MRICRCGRRKLGQECWHIALIVEQSIAENGDDTIVDNAIGSLALLSLAFDSKYGLAGGRESHDAGLGVQHDEEEKEEHGGTT